MSCSGLADVTGGPPAGGAVKLAWGYRVGVMLRELRCMLR